MANQIEWQVPFSGPTTSGMSVAVLDNSGLAHTVLDDSQPFDIEFKWDVPAALALLLGGRFRLRAYAESIGPGQEVPLLPGGPMFVNADGSASYSAKITVPANTLQGENVNPARSGVYQIVGVIQHISVGGVATEVCGFSASSMVQIRTP